MKVLLTNKLIGIIVIASTISLTGCITNTSEPIEKFFQSGYESDLYPGERVLYFKHGCGRGGGYGKVYAITDERILLYGKYTYGLYRDETFQLFEIKNVEPEIKTSFLGLKYIDDLIVYMFASGQEYISDAGVVYMLDSSNALKINYCFYEDGINIIKTQLDYINTIRSELGISVPATVTTSELIKLNEPVIAELRARRQIK